jgi:Spy/CpxP family protein refolding chaperone
MSPFSQWKTIAYAAAIFVAGGISGGALGVYVTKSHLQAPPREQELALRMKTRLQNKLGLTPDQAAKIDPIVDNAAKDLRDLRARTFQGVNKIFEDTYSQISTILTPEQRAKLEQMQKERRDMMQTHWQEGRHHPGESPGDADHGGPSHDEPSAAPH